MKCKIETTLVDHMGSDLSVVNAARVSFGKKSNPLSWVWYEYESGEAGGEYIAHLNESDTRLIQYLAKHKHMSPFGHAFLSFHVKAPVFVARQLVKHKFLRWNEISRRYVDDEPEIYEPEVWRGRSKDKKQGSHGDITDYAMNFVWWDGYELGDELKFYNKGVVDMYKRMVEIGIAPEQARMVLPQSTMTEWYWSGSLDAFASMCKLRCAEDTQYETRLVANQISEVIGTLFPVSWNAIMEGETDE